MRTRRGRRNEQQRLPRQRRNDRSVCESVVPCTVPELARVICRRVGRCGGNRPFIGVGRLMPERKPSWARAPPEKKLWAIAVCVPLSWRFPAGRGDISSETHVLGLCAVCAAGLVCHALCSMKGPGAGLRAHGAPLASSAMWTSAEPRCTRRRERLRGRGIARFAKRVIVSCALGSTTTRQPLFTLFTLFTL